MDSREFNKKLHIKELIGRGSFGDVFKASYISEDGSENMTVVARIFNNSINISSLTENFEILLCLQHENIVKHLNLTITNRRPTMVMEYADCGSLYNFLDDKDKWELFTTHCRINWMRQCAKGLVYLHSQNFINYNLNTKDLLLTDEYRTMKIIPHIEFLKSTLEQENIDFRKKEIFDFGMILLGVMSHKNFCYNSEENNINKVARSVSGIVFDIKNDANLTHVRTLIENCTINVAANASLPTMEDVEFLLNIDRAEDLEYLKRVGAGSFGKVYKANWASFDGRIKTVAAKEIDMNKINGILREITILSRLKHANIVSYFGVTLKWGKVLILMEYADRGSLYNALHGPDRFEGPIPKGEWMFQCAKGLAYLHEQKIMHRDLKTKNLVITESGILKICDFGLVKNVETTNTSVMGTFGYMAPEVCQGRLYSEKCDVFSYGIVLWEIMSEEKPLYELEGMHILAQQRKVNKGYRPKLDDAMNNYDHFDNIKTVMEQCWSHEEENRPSMQQVIDYFQNKMGFS